MTGLMKINNEKIYNSLDKIIPNPICELNYKKDYELVIAVMLSAQTTDKRVNIVTNSLFNKYDTLEKLSKLSIKEIENEIRTIGLFKNKAKHLKNIVKSLLENGYVPNNREELEKLSGIGRKSASVILSELFNIPSMPVDTHVERVSKRLGLAFKNDNVLVVEKKLCKKFEKEKWNRIHKQLVLFGRYHCTSKKPKCDVCPFEDICKYKNAIN